MRKKNCLFTSFYLRIVVFSFSDLIDMFPEGKAMAFITQHVFIEITSVICYIEQTNEKHSSYL